jgi:hypothetical protein
LSVGVKRACASLLLHSCPPPLTAAFRSATSPTPRYSTLSSPRSYTRYSVLSFPSLLYPSTSPTPFTLNYLSPRSYTRPLYSLRPLHLHPFTLNCLPLAPTHVHSIAQLQPVTAPYSDRAEAAQSFREGAYCDSTPYSALSLSLSLSLWLSLSQ